MFRNLLKIREEKGTALITALLVMGILTAISLAVSTLIVREISITRLAIDSGKAYYTAEAGIEEALLALKNGNVGENVDDGKVKFTDENGVGESSYTIKNTSTTYPVVNENGDGAVAVAKDPSAYYSYLDVNESVTIPLFTGSGEGDEGGKVKDFVVQFFPNFKPEELIFSGKDVRGWDVLRWKVYGIVEEGKNKGKTESINDFTSFASVTTSSNSSDTGGKSVLLTGANIPSWFGTWDESECSEQTEKEGIKCAQYTSSGVVKSVLEDGQTVFQGSCLQTQAREHYYYDDAGNMNVMDCYDIKNFLSDHNQNYLVLTNLMNPSVLKDDEQKVRFAKSRLYYRVVTDKPMPREFAEITATGKAGDSQITLSMLRKRDSFMPVFNFALYHTKQDPK